MKSILKTLLPFLSVLALLVTVNAGSQLIANERQKTDLAVQSTLQDKAVVTLDGQQVVLVGTDAACFKTMWERRQTGEQMVIKGNQQINLKEVKMLLSNNLPQQARIACDSIATAYPERS